MKRQALEILRDFIRPLTAAALVAALLLGACVSAILETVLPGLGIQFTTGAAGWFRAVPDPFYQLTGLMGASYVAARSYEKVKQEKYANAATAPATAPLPDVSRAVDSPDGEA